MPRMTDDELAREAARWETLRAVPTDWLPAPGAVPRAGLTIQLTR